MRPHEIETWALHILNRVKSGHPIERLGLACRSSKTQEEIRDAFSQTQWELNGLNLPSVGQHSFSETTDSGENSILPALVTLSAGLKNRRPRGAAKTSGSHFRLAAISSQAKDNLSFWCAYLAAQRIGSSLPYLVIAANGKRWIDLIVGEPLQNDFFCLRANEIALPTSWIEIEGTELRILESEAKLGRGRPRMGTQATAISPPSAPGSGSTRARCLRPPTW